MRVLGPIVRLQVQVDSIKTGTRPLQTYVPEPHLTSVKALSLNPDGVEGVDDRGETLPDIHNATHSKSKFNGVDNGISIGFTSHYTTMRGRFGDHLTDGIAGENILVECDESISLETIEKGIIIVGEQGEIQVGPWVILHPCAPFTKFCLGIPGDTKPDKTVTEGLRFLEHGMRGFSTVYPTDVPPARIQLGDMVYAVE